MYMSKTCFMIIYGSILSLHVFDIRWNCKCRFSHFKKQLMLWSGMLRHLYCFAILPSPLQVHNASSYLSSHELHHIPRLARKSKIKTAQFLLCFKFNTEITSIPNPPLFNTIPNSPPFISSHSRSRPTLSRSTIPTTAIQKIAPKPSRAPLALRINGQALPTTASWLTRHGSNGSRWTDSKLVAVPGWCQ